MPISAEPALTIEAYLLSIITAATEGSGLLAVQSNVYPAGTSGIQNVQKVVPPAENIFPSVGLKFDRYTGDIYGSGVGVVRDVVVAHFDIVVSVMVQGDLTEADTRLAARLALANYIFDGNGNGMSPLLRGDRTLGGTCTSCWIESLDETVAPMASGAAGTIASAWYRLAAKALAGLS